MFLKLHNMKTWNCRFKNCVNNIHSITNRLLSRHSERGKKTRRTEEELKRQNQGMDRPGVRQVPEDSGEQGEMEETGAKSSVAPQRSSRLRDRWDEMSSSSTECCIVGELAFGSVEYRHLTELWTIGPISLGFVSSSLLCSQSTAEQIKTTSQSTDYSLLPSNGTEINEHN